MAPDAKLYFQIVTTSGVPIYRQIQDQVKTLVATGRFKPGEFLPSVRQVASDLEVNPMTVSKAYSTLEAEGVLEYVRGTGMRIKETGSAEDDMSAREAAVTPLLKEVIARSKQLSLGRSHLEKLIRTLWEKDNG